MNPLIRRFLTPFIFLILVTAHGFAGGSSPRPVSAVFPRIMLFGHYGQAIRVVDSFLSAPVAVSPLNAKDGSADGGQKLDMSSSRGRICSCQILNLSSSNYDHRHIALLAEKTNHGSSGDFDAVKSSIEKEKRKLKKMFYDKVKVVSAVTAVGSCQSMYVQLKREDNDLQVYEILNADIR